jgi:Clr5 domain
MASISLKWEVRAPQAPFIPDREWEKHRALICQLRPTLTLNKLIEVMDNGHNFKAS